MSVCRRSVRISMNFTIAMHRDNRYAGVSRPRRLRLLLRAAQERPLKLTPVMGATMPYDAVSRQYIAAAICLLTVSVGVVFQFRGSASARVGVLPEYRASVTKALAPNPSSNPCIDRRARLRLHCALPVGRSPSWLRPVSAFSPRSALPRRPYRQPRSTHRGRRATGLLVVTMVRSASDPATRGDFIDRLQIT